MNNPINLQTGINKVRQTFFFMGLFLKATQWNIETIKTLLIAVASGKDALPPFNIYHEYERASANKNVPFSLHCLLH